MAAPRRVVELVIGESDLSRLISISRSRTEPASRVERARMLLAYRDKPSFFAVGQALRVHHQTVRRCIERAAADGPLAALEDAAQSPCPGPCPGQGSPPQPRVHRIPQAPRCRLSDPCRDQADPGNHSAHISKETRAWIAAQPNRRFAFTFTPRHGSWLNLVEGFFSKLARSVLRHIRVASKQEPKERIIAAIDDINRHPVVHTWSYQLDAA